MKHLFIFPVFDVLYTRTVMCGKMNEYEECVFK